MLLWLSAALAAPLSLGEVRTAVEDGLPVLEASAAKIDAAEAKLLSAQGAFDPTLVGKASRYDGSDPRSLSVLSLGGETLLGPTVEVGIRRSDGSLKPYETELETGESGEWFARAEIELDEIGLSESRMKREQAAAGVAIAEQVFEDKRQQLHYKASAAYWKWVGSGGKLQIERDLLALSESRIAALEQQVAAGSASPMDLLDAQRARLERQARVVAAEADLDIAARVLALYLQDAVSADRLPALSSPAPVEALAQLLQQAAARPELVALAEQVALAERQLQRARLDRLPDAVIIGQAAEDIALGKSEWLVGAELKLSTLQRKERGRVAAALAEVERLQATEAWRQAEIAAEVEAAWTAAEAARQQVELIAATEQRAAEVLVLEQRRYELGDSDLFKLLLREDKLAEVRKYLVIAQTEAWIRQAALQRAVGLF